MLENHLWLIFQCYVWLPCFKWCSNEHLQRGFSLVPRPRGQGPSSHSSPFKSVGFSYKHQPAAWTMLDHVGCQTYRQPSSQSASSIRFQDGSQTVRNIYGNITIQNMFYRLSIYVFSYTIHQFWRTNSIDYGNPMVSSAKPGWCWAWNRLCQLGDKNPQVWLHN